MNTATKEQPKPVGLNIEIPEDVHRRAKAAAALAGLTWNKAVTEALDQWAQRRMKK